jgi:hypothetical protein
MKKIALLAFIVAGSYNAKSQGIIDEILSGKTSTPEEILNTLTNSKIYVRENGITPAIPNIEIKKIETGTPNTLEVYKRGSNGLMLPTHRIKIVGNDTYLIPIVNGIPDYSKALILRK